MPAIEVKIKVTELESGKFQVETVEGKPLVVRGDTLPEAMGQMCGMLESRFQAKVGSVEKLRASTGALAEPLSFLEAYTRERKAEFLLSSATDPEDYAQAVEEVRKLGIDPSTVPHYKPAGV